ncbi:UV radiation resistance-associated gene protein isoform X1 [Bombus pascuorum]|uniref:UV radiation resistance-associated gene protein isoform X1 n=1 Tax=Bombus pascuorum TaxID=65598 RepID=UPI0021340AF8|nr:UV radiation resistance-associated gene protein isoform X1 [Bombus pascuorum]XP_060817908.1 UV radiation resistance-associated gene protein isoform X1 [Bombus pascuorum]
MEISETKNLVRDLDLTLQPRIFPRYKSWLPLATQQLRLRNLVQIIGCNLKTDINNEICWFYYTLHRTSMSSPIYTSEAIDNTNPRWSSLEVPTIYATSYSTASEVIVRLWKRIIINNATTDQTIFTWGISFTGLAYIGPKLSNNLETILKENSLIFQFHGGFFTPVYCFIETPELKRYLHIKVNASEIRDSYTVSKLTSLRNKMQALKQQTESVQTLRIQIASGDNFHPSKYPQSSLNRLLQPRKVSREKKAEILKIRKELEIAKFRTKLLEQERARKMGELRVLNQMHSNIMEENQDYGSDLMERYRELNKDIERLHEWRQNQIDTRETYIQLSSQLAHRRRQLISELSLIYPISQGGNGKFRIHDVHLPDSEDLELSNDTVVAVALGFVAHTTQMIANFLNIPTRYPIIHYGSRSKVIDHITENLPDNERQFPLFARSKDKLQFRYAVYLLNKNIAQLRWYCGLPTTDLRATLPNLATLINIKPNQSHLDNSKRTYSTSSLDIEVGNSKQSITPPMQKIIFEKCHRSSRSMSQLKSIKSSLGSSLDQGLDKPVQSLVLGSQSKRICKSEESAIDNKTLVLVKDRSSNSSNETLNNAILNNITNVENSSEVNNETAIENNIEIMIPTSVSKSTNITDNFDSPVNIRDRSSNSISSCEMALTSSQNGDDSSNDNNIIKKDEAKESISIINEILININDVVDNTLKNGKHSEDYNLENKAPQDSDNLKMAASDKSCNDHEHMPVTTETSTYRKEHFTKSCLSLDDIISCAYEETEKKERTSSICSYPEEYLSSKYLASRKRYNSESKKDRIDSVHSKNLCHKNTSRESVVETELMQTAQKSDCYSYDETNKCDFPASDEYIDIIRRSSESVYARTEALANKKTSFKVMKPRL